MNKAFSMFELLVVITIIIILIGMLIPAINLVRNKANLAKKGTEVTSDTWKTSGNMTPSGAVQTYIITDPTNNQKWIVVSRNTNNCSIIPYVPHPLLPKLLSNYD